MWLFKCLKNFVSEHLPTVNMGNSLKTRTIALPPYCFISLAKIRLENIRRSVCQIIGVFVITLTADDKYSLFSRENLPQPIQLQLSEKKKIFLNFLVHI